MIERADAITLARRYVAASNAHDLDVVRVVLAGDVGYSSSAVGEHARRVAFLEMMEDFSARFAGVRWS